MGRSTEAGTTPGSCDTAQVPRVAHHQAAADASLRLASAQHTCLRIHSCCAPQDIKELSNKHLGPLVKNLLPAGKKLPIKRAVK